MKRTYPAIDATDKVSCRPDYCLLVYPAYLDGENFQLAPELKVSSATPPTMLIQAEDDKSYINSSIFYYYALRKLGFRHGCIYIVKVAMDTGYEIRERL